MLILNTELHAVYFLNSKGYGLANNVVPAFCKFMHNKFFTIAQKL